MSLRHSAIITTREQQLIILHKLFMYCISELAGTVCLSIIQKKMLISWLDALCLNNRHKVFSDAVKDCRNLALRIVSCALIGRKLTSYPVNVRFSQWFCVPENCIHVGLHFARKKLNFCAIRDKINSSLSVVFFPQN